MDSLLERAQWNEARLELDAAADVAVHWPALGTELMRLRGRLERGRQELPAARKLWRQALEIDAQNRHLPGALRCVELLSATRELDRSAVQLCSTAFPDWMEAELDGEVFAPLAAVQRLHRTVGHA